MKITVTQEMINAAKRLRMEDVNADISLCCPVAIALKPLFPGMDVFAGKWQAVAINQDTKKGGCINLPQEVTDFIFAFDAGKPVKPISFTVR